LTVINVHLILKCTMRYINVLLKMGVIMVLPKIILKKSAKTKMEPHSSVLIIQIQ
jgi:hypothetical protein